MYLLDANVFIDANRQYYPFDVCPGFWDWLDLSHDAAILASIVKVREELIHFGDDLSEWARGRPDFFLEPDDAVVSSLSDIARWVSERDYTPAARAEFLDSADYYLIAQSHAYGHTVVTHERPEPNRMNKVKIPDVCGAFGVEWLSPFVVLSREGAEFVLQRSSGSGNSV